VLGIAELVGRVSELERVDAVLDVLAAGQAATLAIEGEPGIGKTRLLSELRRRAESRGYLVLGAAASEFEQDVSFGIWVDALDAYVASHDPVGDEWWGAEFLSAVSVVVPSLAGPGVGMATVLADERYRTHRAVRQFLERLAARRPLVVVLDDVQWMDAGSSELLVSLLRRRPEAPVLLAVAFRSGTARERLARGLAAGGAVAIELRPLSESECSRLAGGGLDRRQRAAILSESGGNP
jgi:predicted ATPase